MSDEEGQGFASVGDGVSLETTLEHVGVRSEVMMDVLELVTALILIVLFAMGVYDLGLRMVEMVRTGTYTDPDAIIHLIDTALLLLIIVEIYRTVIAYVEDLNILPIVLNVGVIAMARKIISFRTTKYATKSDALMSAVAYGLLMIVVVASLYFLHRIQNQADFDIYSIGEE